MSSRQKGDNLLSKRGTGGTSKYCNSSDHLDCFCTLEFKLRFWLLLSIGDISSILTCILRVT